MTAYCMTINDLCPTLSPFRSFANESKGLSQEAKFISKTFSDLYEDYNYPITLGQTSREIKNYFLDIAKECSEDNWDGYGAKSFDIVSFCVAANFLLLLPSNFQKPEINVDPDGEVALEWFNGANKVFSVSFSNNGNLSYAGLFGINKAHGTEYFENEIPETILENINRVFS
jgi:hypothetical protein